MTKQLCVLIQDWATQIENAYGHLPSHEFPGPPNDLVRHMRAAAARLLMSPVEPAVTNERAAFEAYYRATCPDADLSHPNWDCEWRIWQAAWTAARAADEPPACNCVSFWEFSGHAPNCPMHSSEPERTMSQDISFDLTTVPELKGLSFEEAKAKCRELGLEAAIWIPPPPTRWQAFKAWLRRSLRTGS